MASDFIKISRSDPNATYSGDLLGFVSIVRQVLDQGDKILEMMSHNWETGDYTDLEALYGLPAGTGADVLFLVTGIMDALHGRAQNDYAEQIVARIG